MNKKKFWGGCWFLGTDCYGIAYNSFSGMVDRDDFFKNL